MRSVCHVKSGVTISYQPVHDVCAGVVTEGVCLTVQLALNPFNLELDKFVML